MSSEKIKQDGQDWPRLLSWSLDEYCRANGYLPKSILGDKLGIPSNKWRPISAGSSILLENEWYAILYYHTGLTEADPRTIPPRLHVSRGSVKLIERAMTEEEWQKWLVQYKSTSVHPETDLESDSTENHTPPSIQQPPQEHKNIPEVKVSKSREFRRIMQRRHDAYFEEFMSRIIPRYVDAQDTASVDELLWALSRIFDQLKNADIRERTRFAQSHGRTLAHLHSFIEAYSLSDEKKREQMLASIFNFEINVEGIESE